MNKYCLTITSVALFALLTSFNDNSWILKKEKEGISVYTRTVNGSSFAESKGVVVIKGSIKSFVAMLKDIEAYPQWVPDCLEARLINNSNINEQTHYVLSDAPYPLENRDVIIHLNFIPNENGSLEVNISSKPNLLPVKNDVVRIVKMQGSWRVKQINADEIKIEYQLHVEPGGTVPSWIANAFVVDNPFNTLANIKTHIRNVKYQK